MSRDLRQPKDRVLAEHIVRFVRESAFRRDLARSWPARDTLGRDVARTSGVERQPGRDIELQR